jgi:nicotinate phosphoribosyltransferase
MNRSVERGFAGSAVLPEVGALALFTDLYELKMLQAYLEEGMEQEAVFSLFVRRLPEARNYLLACGLDTVLDFLERLRFTDDDIRYIASLEGFSARFLEQLKDFRFTGEVHAVPEGTPVFANEPLLEVIAPIAQGQLIETLVMNQVHLQTVLASKAARVVAAAQGRAVVDFGARRMHGIDAALKAARAFYIAGVASTSNVVAGRAWGIPVAGTMAHSYIQAHDSEEDAFAKFAALYPDTILLVDTYDTLAGVRRVIDLARRLGDAFKVSAVRLDSGDLGALAKQSRALLDAAGLQRVKIFASGGLDEFEVGKLVEGGAPIDGFGVGTAMGVSDDVPALDIAYKLSEYAGKGRLKLSTGKPVLPGRKQIFRREESGRATGDVIGCDDEKLPGRPLMRTVMQNGRRLAEAALSLSEIRAHAEQEMALLPEQVRRIALAHPPYPVEISARLQAKHARIAREMAPPLR